MFIAGFLTLLTGFSLHLVRFRVFSLRLLSFTVAWTPLLRTCSFSGAVMNRGNGQMPEEWVSFT